MNLNLFKKRVAIKEMEIPSSEKQQIDAVETWVVRWLSRYGEFSNNVRPECEVFTSFEDAEKFKQALIDAFKLIKHTYGARVTVSKND